MKTGIIVSCLLLSFIGFSQTELKTGDACFDKKDYDCALSNYLAGYNKALYTADLKYYVEYRIGYSNYETKKLNEAKAWYIKSIASKSDYGYVWWDLAYILYSQNRYDSAITCYRKAHQYLTKQEDKENMLYWTAWSYRGKYEYTSAVNEFKKIISRTNSYRLTDYNIADTYLQISNYDSALVYAKKAQAHIPVSDSMYWELQLRFARIYKGKKEYGKAHEALDISSAANPKKPGLLEWERGIVFANNNEYPKAVEAYKKSLTYYSDSVNIRTLWGNIVACYRKTTEHAKLISAIYNYMPYLNDKENLYKEIANVQYIKLKQPKEANKTVELFISKLGKELDSNKTNMKSVRAYLHSLQGLISLDAKDSSQAKKYFTDALRVEYSNMTANLRMGDIAWNRKIEDDFKKYYTNMFVNTSDTILNSKEDISRAYARKSHVRYNFYSYKASDIKTDVESALKYDSLQKEVVYLWALVLKDHYSLVTYRDRCLGLLEKGIKNIFQNCTMQKL